MCFHVWWIETWNWTTFNEHVFTMTLNIFSRVLVGHIWFLLTKRHLLAIFIVKFLPLNSLTQYPLLTQIQLIPGELKNYTGQNDFCAFNCLFLQRIHFKLKKDKVFFKSLILAGLSLLVTWSGCSIQRAGDTILRGNVDFHRKRCSNEAFWIMKQLSSLASER